MLKKDALRNPESCLNKAAACEPVFVLRANDPLAGMAVRHWAAMAEGTHEPEKIADAIETAQCMDAWHAQHVPGIFD